MDYARLNVPLIDGSQAPEDVGKNFNGPQNPKQCKKTTPDFVEGTPGVKATKKREEKPGTPQIGFRTKDRVMIELAVSLLNKVTLIGEYIFDSYDSYDNTCYVLDEKRDITFNVLLTDIKLKKDE